MKHLSMAVVVKNGLVLVQKRFRRDMGMVLEFPGGSVDKGETGVEAAMRELWEETGLDSVKPVGKTTLKNDFGGDIHYCLLALVNDSEPKPVDPTRKQTFYWLKPEDIPLDDFYESDRLFINQYLASILTHQ